MTLSPIKTLIAVTVIAAAPLTMASAAGPAASPAAAPPSPQTQMVKIEDSRLAVVYAVPNLDLKAYTSVLVEQPMGVDYQRGNQDMYRLSKGDLKKLNEYALEAFQRHLTSDGRYKLATQPGPGVLVVRGRLKDVWLAFSKNAGGAGRSYTMGEYAIQMTLEAELIDGETGEVLAIAADRKGERVNHSVRRLTSLDAWQQVKKAFDFWAASLRLSLDEARK